MDISLEIAIQSHLSDAIVETQIDLAKVRQRIRFAKHLIQLKQSGIESLTNDELSKIWNETSDEEEL